MEYAKGYNFQIPPCHFDDTLMTVLTLNDT